MAEPRGIFARLSWALALPPPPAAPWGDPSSVRTFRAGRGYRRMRRLGLAWTQSWALILIVVGLNADRLLPDPLGTMLSWPFIQVFEWLALVLFPLQLAVAILILELDWRQRWYLVTDRSLRIREGIFRVHEMTISLLNVQNVGLRQGPIQRLFGIGDVEVRTAGGGSGTDTQGASAGMHIGRLRGIADAESVRDEIVARWSAVRRETAIPVAADEAAGPLDLAAAARRFEDAARALGALARGLDA